MKVKKPLPAFPAWMRRYIIEGEFALSSGNYSKWFIDMKGAMLGPHCPRLALHVSRVIEDLIEADPRHIPGEMAIAGPELGGAMLAMMLRRYFRYAFVIRPAVRAGGLRQRVEGHDWKGPVVLVDDVTTTGRTLVESASLLEERGLNIVGVIAVVDRGGGAAVTKAGYDFTAVWSVPEER
jgi:orotate phosphoribosyltransferase